MRLLMTGRLRSSGSNEPRTFRETLMVGVARRSQGVEELIEAGNPANILGRGTTGAIHEARVVKRRVGGGDILDRFGMPPVVAES